MCDCPCVPVRRLWPVPFLGATGGTLKGGPGVGFTCIPGSGRGVVVLRAPALSAWGSLAAPRVGATLRQHTARPPGTTPHTVAQPETGPLIWQSAVHSGCCTSRHSRFTNGPAWLAPRPAHSQSVSASGIGTHSSGVGTLRCGFRSQPLN